MGEKTKRAASLFLVNLLIIMLIVYVGGPFVWMAVASIQGENDLLRHPPDLIPKHPTLDNYNYVFTGKIPTSYEVKGQLRSRISQEARLIAPALKNSFIVAITVMAINLIIGMPAAYTFARLNFKGKKPGYNFILASRLMPAMAVAIPYYVIIQTLKLLDTYLALILVHSALTLPFTIWFLSLYIGNIPREMEDAGLVDGCTPFQALTRIVVPMMAPGLVAAAAFAFMTSYNEFLFARFLTQTIKSQTGPMIIASISGNPDASYSLISVCITLGVIPPLILAITMRKWLTQGLSASITFRSTLFSLSTGGLVSSNAESFEKVTAYESTIRLPTYAIQGENPNPVFRSQYGVAHIYPYTLLDDIASSPSEKTYRTLVLENRYLRVTVIPDLGGRVYSLYDKTSDREVFYKNAIVKFSPLAIRGAFFSGGLEFSFPVAHAPTTADPVNWDIRHNEDGSASISFGGLEHISRLRWMITLTLYPDRCALAQDVQLYNPYTIPGRYHYWTNASLDADDRTEFVYPLRRVRSYEFAGTASWPVARLDLIQKDPGLPGMEGVPMWPADRMQEPFNFRWQKNMLAQVSIFGRDVAWDFFGAWQHSTNAGYAHFADHKDVAGMKLWSWGNAGVGVVNQTALTDDGSLYAETQCGAMETQLDFAFLQPAAMRSWREWWIPLRGMGGLTCASAEAGLRLELAYSQEAGVLNVTIGVCPARDLGKSRVEVSVPGKTLLDETASLSPDQPWLARRTVRAGDLAGNPIHVVVRDQAGTVVLDYTLDRDTSPIAPSEPARQEGLENSETFTQLGLKHENFDNREQALAAYRKSIELSSENGEAHFRLGLMLLRAADLPAAAGHFKEAVSLGLVDGNYYLGLVGLLEGELEAARKAFQAVPVDHPLQGPALLGLGSLAMRDKDWQKAIELFRQACLMGGKPITAALLLGIALQRAGQNEDARVELEWALSADPLNHAALRELAHMQPEGPYQARLARLLADDRQYRIDLACFYIDAGLIADALPVLEDVAQVWPYPMLGYLAAYIYKTLDRQEEADTWLAWAAAGNPEHVFPSRLEEFTALKHAIERNPGDYKAKYYLGNLLYARQRFDEGVRLWQDALPGLADFDVLHRNLGLAAWQREKDLPKATALLEKGLALNPNNQDIYLHLDDLYKAQGLAEKRQQLLEKIESLPKAREDVRKRGVLIRVDLGRYEEALRILQTEQFVPLEMDQSFHELYVRALMQRADARSRAGKVEEAIADYRTAIEFPANLGVGQPTTLAQAHIYYHLGLAYEQLGRFQEALLAWRQATCEHHSHGGPLYEYVQMALDKLSRYSELGLDV